MNTTLYMIKDMLFKVERATGNKPVAFFAHTNVLSILQIEINQRLYQPAEGGITLVSLDQQHSLFGLPLYLSDRMPPQRIMTVATLDDVDRFKKEFGIT